MNTTTPRISRITVGRLYNLGNYEHVRYELTVDIPEKDAGAMISSASTSASTAIRGVEKILDGLKPIDKCGVKAPYELARDARRIEAMKALDDGGWQREYGHCKGTREEVIARYEEQHAEDKAKRAAAEAKAKRARELFDDLGGTEHWKDAKLDWENNDSY